MDYTKGRNLLQKSSTFVLADWVGTRRTVPETGIVRVTPTTGSAYGKFKVDYLTYGTYKNRPLTFSCDVRTVETGTYAGANADANLYIGIQKSTRLANYFDSGTDKYQYQALTNVTSEWQRFSFTIDSLDVEHLTKGLATYEPEDTDILSVEVYRAAKREPAEFRNIKLEIGTEATPYRPAPEDSIPDFDYWILARNSITVSIQRDIDCAWRLYRIASSTSTPSAPTQNEAKTIIDSGTLPTGWSKVEPSYDGTSTNSLYTVDITGYTDGTVNVSDVSKSSSYEAAKEAYNKSLAVESDLNASRAWYAVCETAAGTVDKVATVSPATTEFSLHEGSSVFVKFTATNSGAVASLTLNVNGSGAKPIKYIYNGELSNIPAVGYLKTNQTYQFYYDGTNWVVQMIYNTNTNYVDRCQYGLALAASAAISAARIAVLGTNGKLHILDSSPFDMMCPPLYVATAYSASNVNSGTLRASNYRYWGAAFNLTSTHAIEGAAAGKTVYIVGTMSEDIFTPNTTVLTCIEPVTEDNLYYMRLGKMSTEANGVLEMDHPIYVFYDGQFLTIEEAEAGKAKKVATNYLASDDTGIMIADLEDGEQTPSTATGRNVKIDDETVDIRDGQRVLARYGENTLIGDPTDYHVGIGTANYAEVDLSNLSWSTRYTGSINKTLSTSLPTAYEGYEEKIRIICENYSLKGFVGGVGSLSTPDTHDVGFYGYKNSSNPRSATIYLVVPVNHSPSGKMIYNTADPDATPSIKLYSEGQKVLAKFGQSVSIGDASGQHIEIDEAGFETKLNETDALIFIGVINDPENDDYAEILERTQVREISIVGENEDEEFVGLYLNTPCVQLLDIKYGNTSILNLATMYDDRTVKFTSSASTYLYEYVTVTYYTDSLVPCFRFGENNTCKSKYAVVFGTRNEVYASYALATGYGCKIYGPYSVAEGYESSAIGMASHAEGFRSNALGYYAHAEGYSNDANGGASHAEGNNTEANGVYSHAEGNNTAANGQCSHAAGEGTIARGSHQTAIGKYNVEDLLDRYALIVGNGSGTGNRSNALAIKWDGTPISPAISYSPNDTFSVTQLNVSGVMAVTNTTVILELETDKYMDQVSTVTVTSLVGALRGVNGYIDGSRYDTNWITSAYTVTATKKSRKHVEIRITKPNSTTFTNATTDTPLSLYATMTLTFTT